ncbi:MAG TPA: efflux RND transporter periplasmic adaptor subunit [Pyrinomonadaceae bacterium]|jgi:RND family efflux transporter MFP subunit|nr:efflux RND transporter periplasmic adaptor subunit [Pyrinomonadaceae bacterium]
MKKNHLTFVSLTVPLMLSAAILSACGSKTTVNVNANSQPTVVDVTTTQAIVKPIPTYFEATGNLASDESTDVAPNVAGKIAEVNFDVGSFVQRGSVLVRLDPRDAQIRLEQAEAQVEQQRKALGTAEAAAEQARVRLGLKPGERFDIETFSQVKTVKANLDLAEKELTRSQRLYESGDLSRSAYDQRKSQRDAILGQLDEARSTAAVAVRAINSAEAQVAAARAAIATAQTQVDQARKGVNDTAILAPISGYVSERVADPGEYISPSAPNAKIATIVRTSPLRLRIDVPEASIGKVSMGQGISLQTSAYPDRNFAGTVVRVLPGLNTAARTLTVEAEVANSDGLLKPGQFATVRITQSKPENAVMVSASAVKAEGDTNKVFVIKDGAAHERIVQIGLLEGDTIQIKQGLEEGEVIATSNLGQLYDGILVRAN